jgi:hypothetical protein
MINAEWLVPAVILAALFGAYVGRALLLIAEARELRRYRCPLCGQPRGERHVVCANAGYVL